jgi:hypothetical protein
MLHRNSSHTATDPRKGTLFTGLSVKLLVGIGALLSATGAATASDLCKAIALRDVAAIENPKSVIRKGDIDTAITQYQVEKATRRGSFCSHGGYCYPDRINVDGGDLIALRLLNCTVSKHVAYSDAQFMFFELDVNRMAVEPGVLRESDVSDKLQRDLSLCSACAQNVAAFYVRKPQSQCAALTRRVLEGDTQAGAILQGSPAYCGNFPWKEGKATN